MAGENLPAPTTPAASSTAAAMAVGPRGIEIKTYGDLWSMATTIYRGGLAPESLVKMKPGEDERAVVSRVAIAIQTGLEVGLTPMAAVRGIAVINNRPSWMGKTALALVERSRVLERAPSRRYVGKVDESKKGLDAFTDEYGCEVTIHRRGNEPQVFLFTVGDAKTANLWKKAGPWSQFPKDMLWWRALGRGLDALCSDVLAGVELSEVVEDYDERQRFARARDVNERPPAPAGAAPSRDPLLEHFEGAAKQPERSEGSEREVAPAPDPRPEGAASQHSVAPSAPSAGPLFDRGLELDEPPPHEHAWTWEMRPGADDDHPVEVKVCTGCDAVDEGPFA